MCGYADWRIGGLEDWRIGGYKIKKIYLMNTIRSNGKVILAGAGPGDPELVTLKTVRYLQQADVVLTDRLVSQDILNHHVNKYARIIYAGKQAGREDSTSQSYINEMMADFALQDKLV